MYVCTMFAGQFAVILGYLLGQFLYRDLQKFRSHVNREALARTSHAQTVNTMTRRGCSKLRGMWMAWYVDGDVTGWLFSTRTRTHTTRTHTNDDYKCDSTTRI